MEKDEYLEELGIDGEQSISDDGAIVITLNEQSWQDAQTTLDEKSRDESEYGLYEDDESSTISYESSNLQYLTDYFIINLIADFQADDYKLIIKDR